MSASVVLGVLGLAFSASNALSGPSYPKQDLEGVKTCETEVMRVLLRDDVLYVKIRDRVLTFTEKPTQTNVRRFETYDSKLVFLQLPEKTMLLDNVRMKPLLTECKTVNTVKQ